MNRVELFFERPTELFASEPPEMRGHGRDDVRLMVTTEEGHSHHRFTDLPGLLEPGDLLVVNESATLPASLPATGRLGDILLNLSTRFAEDLWLVEPRWSSARPGPLPLQEREILTIGDASAMLLDPLPGIPRLSLARFNTEASTLMAKYGGPHTLWLCSGLPDGDLPDPLLPLPRKRRNAQRRPAYNATGPGRASSPRHRYRGNNPPHRRFQLRNRG